MEQALILIRGVQGSGKSTVAQKLLSLTNGNVSHFEADMFFINSATGEYNFNADKLHKAHTWCFRQTQAALDDGDTVIVSNTFVTNKEVKRYIELGLSKSLTVRVIECTGNYSNIHGVPQDKIEKNRARFVTNEQLSEMWSDHEKAELLIFE